ncbi:PhoH family protein [Corynebacterium striatum]|uniref:PhoH-like protein n=1 Tax=Corynebacterium striatum TaxID=43770 RepID=A0ABC9ZMD5_CORST|nr:PhoH family protein [Corynebacterium striatum]EEI78918.1 PhoH family protein [Corynebacterium striatum ATCC 6940]MBD0855582.1 PhoH family protein [Corynebacterium striatum]PIS62418.1 phosphate starvation-inducible protein PhoH [Corynebacterium striatum]PIS63538.1 phosphate starvation-inducible protein PhoH [Corynebacterium striatum]PIS66142.1 phosphate starvation-inducible protein PhoH [Corynebacterium striatum]
MPIITKKFELDSAYVATVLGSADDNLRVLNNLLDADLFARGTTVTVTGPDYEVARAAKVLEELEAIARRGHSVSTDTVKHTVDMVAVDAPQSVSAALAADIVKRRGKSVRPKTVGQSEYVQAIDDNTVVFGIGPAGSGKTYLAVAKAVQALQTKQVSRIILTRPAVEAGEKLGFLPGTLNDKIDPYLRPLYDALRDMLDPEMIPKLMEAGIIEVAPLAYMRGRTLNDAFVILDEAQNTTPAQMKMFLTRLGFGSKIVVTGDISQVDLPRGQISGLRLVRRILEGVPDIHFADLGSGDVVRHQLVGRIVNAYDAAEAKSAAKNAASKYVEEGE